MRARVLINLQWFNHQNFKVLKTKKQEYMNFQILLLLLGFHTFTHKPYKKSKIKNLNNKLPIKSFKKFLTPNKTHI